MAQPLPNTLRSMIHFSDTPEFYPNDPQNRGVASIPVNI